MMQNVEIVEKIARFHLSLVMPNQFIVTIASKTINQKEATEVEVDLAETEAVVDLEVEAEVEAQADMVEIAAVVEDLEEIDHHERCTKQPVETVAMNVKSHLSQDKTNQSIVMTASRITNQKEDNQLFLYK